MEKFVKRVSTGEIVREVLERDTGADEYGPAAENIRIRMNDNGWIGHVGLRTATLKDKRIVGAA